jgi:HTH-type transcriptional regulator/antitoxin HipB
VQLSLQDKRIMDTQTHRIRIGEEIKTRRLALKLTQQQLAELLGRKKAYVSDIERGRKSPSFDTLQPFIEALGGRVLIEWAI